MTGSLFKLSKLLNVPRSTLRYWRKNLLQNPDWLPLHLKDPEKSQVFTSEQQTHLLELIDDVTQKERVPMSNKLFRRMANNYYNELPMDQHPQRNFNFNCSDHYITLFRNTPFKWNITKSFIKS